MAGRRKLVDDFAAEGLPVHDLVAGEHILLDEGTAIRIVVVTPKGTALFIERGAFRMLIPNGVSLYTLQMQGSMQSLSAILLGAADLEMQSASAWQGLASDAIILAAPVPDAPDELPWMALGPHL